jgi:gluconolactonase
MVADGLGWPEGPTVLPDGRLVFVESYRSQLTALGSDRIPRRFAYVAGAPNSCVLGASGWVYVCQNGGTVGPWRAPRWSPRQFRGCEKEVWPRSWLRR